MAIDRMEICIAVQFKSLVVRLEISFRHLFPALEADTETCCVTL